MLQKSRNVILIWEILDFMDNKKNEIKDLKVLGIINLVLTFTGWLIILLISELFSFIASKITSDVPYFVNAISLLPLFIPPIFGLIGIFLSIFNKKANHNRFCMITSFTCFLINWIITNLFVAATAYIQ